MADLQFNCSACGQPIECEKSFARQQLTCPYCQAVITAPVPKPQGRISLSVAPAPSHGTHAPTPSVIPPPSKVPKSKGNKQKIIAAVAVLVIIGGLIAAFPMLKTLQEKLTAKADAAGDAPQEASADTQNSAGSVTTNVEDQASPATASAISADHLPIVEPIHNLEVEECEIPRSKLNGVISAETFTPDFIRFEKSGTAYVLQFVQGTNSFERELSVILRLKPGQSIETNTWTVSKDIKSGAPQVIKKWKTGPRYFAQKSFSTGYAMKLELGKITDGVLPGRIYVALPDKEATVVAGHFAAQTRLQSVSQPIPQ